MSCCLNDSICLPLFVTLFSGCPRLLRRGRKAIFATGVHHYVNLECMLPPIAIEVKCSPEAVDSRVSQERQNGGGRGVTPSLRAGWAGLVRRGPSIVRRLRLASGLVLFS